MREYKFRGKRLDNDEWVEGHYGKKTHPRTGEDQHYILVNVSLMASASSYFVNYEVDPATVGQFTGLTDKHGREIYEGDIVDWFDGMILPISHCPLHARFLIGKDLLTKGAAMESIVIGNIHDTEVTPND